LISVVGPPSWSHRSPVIHLLLFFFPKGRGRRPKCSFFFGGAFNPTPEGCQFETPPGSAGPAQSRLWCPVVNPARPFVPQWTNVDVSLACHTSHGIFFFSFVPPPKIPCCEALMKHLFFRVFRNGHFFSLLVFILYWSLNFLCSF